MDHWMLLYNNKSPSLVLQFQDIVGHNTDCSLCINCSCNDGTTEITKIIIIIIIIIIMKVEEWLHSFTI